MAAMGVGQIRHFARESGSKSGESMTFSGRKMVRPVGRRLFMQASGLAAASAIAGCSGSDTYIIEAVAVAAADIVGVYMIGVPVGTLVAGVVTTVSAADGGDPKPSSVNMHYEAPSSQGNGTLSFEGMPRSSDTKGKASADTQGLGWVQTQNTTDDDIEYVRLLRANGNEVLPTNQGMSGFLNGVWGSGEDLYLTGVPPHDANNPYTKLFFQTTQASGAKQGYIDLA